MIISILRRASEEVIYRGEHESLKDAVEAAHNAGISTVFANLVGANLVGANLVRANLVRANLDGANLDGAKINWNSHALISRILLNAAGNHIGHRKIAGLILVSPDWCWSKWLSLRPSRHFQWAIDTLAAFVQADDGAPPILVNRAAELASKPKESGVAS